LNLIRVKNPSLKFQLDSAANASNVSFSANDRDFFSLDSYRGPSFDIDSAPNPVMGASGPRPTLGNADVFNGE
jgi:hypothetical protein